MMISDWFVEGKDKKEKKEKWWINDKGMYPCHQFVHKAICGSRWSDDVIIIKDLVLSKEYIWLPSGVKNRSKTRLMVLNYVSLQRNQICVKVIDS